MAFSFRNLFSTYKSAAAPGVPPGVRVYAIGDVHGRLDLLDDALAQLEADIDGRPQASNVIVFLGDLIDRGPSSAQVIDRVRNYNRPGVRTVFLSGNHEEVLLRILRGSSELVADWLRFGGAECAQSYGLESAELKRMAPSRAAAAVKAAIPLEHQRFLGRLVDTVNIGDYLLVHAGIRPGVPLSDQSQRDLRWIREPFLEHAADHGFVVVHGHTISTSVDLRANRIGIDTGAYRTGVLTVLALEGSEHWFIQTGAAEEARNGGGRDVAGSRSARPWLETRPGAARGEDQPRFPSEGAL